MPAAFFSLGEDDIFKQSIGYGDSLLSIPEVDKIVQQDGLAVYDSVSLRLGETIQYFLSFDDVIKFIHFGKGVGSLVVEGTLYGDCFGDIPGLIKFRSAVAALRGKEQPIDIGGIVVVGIMTDNQVTIVGDPDTMAKFNFTFSIVDHTLYL
jgi:hypothetical protein